jgi:diguanylate cyclase (GGDEF)-like protein
VALDREWLNDVGSNAYADQLAIGFRRLRFSSPLENEYLGFVRADRFELQRTALGGAILLWTAFAVVDQLIIHTQERWWMLAIRVLVLAFLLTCAVLLVQRKHTHLLNILSIACVSALGLGAAAVVAIAHRVDLYFPYEGLLLVCMAGYFLVGLRLSEALISPLLMLTGYLLFELMVGISTPILLNNLLFLLFGNVIGIVGCYLLEYKSREHFLVSRLMRVLAEHDSLTGLHNRRSFNRQLERLWRLAQREEAGLAMLICDVDFFKRYNDHYGHLGGDGVLQQIGHLLSGAGRRPLDMSVRLGGEEFAVLLYDISIEEACLRAEQLRADLERLHIPHVGSEMAQTVTMSIGVACMHPAQGGALAQLYECADKALYRAKSHGRNQVMS